MWKKVAIAGSVGAVLLGAGTAALAATSSGPSSSPSASPSGADNAPGAGHRKAAGRGLHGEWTTKAGKGSSDFVQHDAIRGSVTAVNPTSLTVQAADGVSETYVLTTSTKVHVAGAKGATGALSDIHVGDKVAVLGTGTGPLTATAIIDRGAKTGSAKS